MEIYKNLRFLKIERYILNDKAEYLSLARLRYEKEVYFEYNDQINFLYSEADYIKFKLENSILAIVVDHLTKGNLPHSFSINMELPFE